MMSGYFVGYFAGAKTIPKSYWESWTYKSFCSFRIDGITKSILIHASLRRSNSLDVFGKNYNWI